MKLKINPFWGIIVGLLAMFAGFTAYDVCGSWVLSGFAFLVAAGIGLCLVDTISRKFVDKKNEGGENLPIGSWERPSDS